MMGGCCLFSDILSSGSYLESTISHGYNRTGQLLFPHDVYILVTLEIRRGRAEPFIGNIAHCDGP